MRAPADLLVHSGAMATRRPLQVALTETARAGWDNLSAEHGATITAIIEAMGQLAGTGRVFPDEVVARARQIDAERRSRRGG